MVYLPEQEFDTHIYTSSLTGKFGLLEEGAIGKIRDFYSLIYKSERTARLTRNLFELSKPLKGEEAKKLASDTVRLAEQTLGFYRQIEKAGPEAKKALNYSRHGSGKQSENPNHDDDKTVKLTLFLFALIWGLGYTIPRFLIPELLTSWLLSDAAISQATIVLLVFLHFREL